MAKNTFFAYHLKSLLNLYERLSDNVSRKDSVCDHFRDAAKAGYFKSVTNFELYPSENKKLEQQCGLQVKPIKKTKSATYSNVSWEDPVWNDPCGEGPPLQVLDYIEGNTDIFPQTTITTLAQELYTIAARANYEKSTRNE